MDECVGTGVCCQFCGGQYVSVTGSLWQLVCTMRRACSRGWRLFLGKNTARVYLAGLLRIDPTCWWG